MYRGKSPGYVVLEDGQVFTGFAFGAPGAVFGEIVFNTGMTGYQEIVTDPSYHGQMVTFTYPMIGNYGVSDDNLESGSVRSKAIVVREAKNTNYNLTCPDPWVGWLAEKGVVGVGGIDTRALTRVIRERGAMTACVAGGPDLRVNDLLEQTRAFPSLSGRDLAQFVTCPEPYLVWSGGPIAGVAVSGVEPGAFWARPAGTAGSTAAMGPVGPGAELDYRVVAYDYGLKRSILRRLLAAGCQVIVVPASFTWEQVLAFEPDGVFLSNGPGDPAPLDYAIANIRGLLGKVPVFGICLGHQLLALAVGLRTYKLKFGHRGINHPVKNYIHDFIEITSQNHGFAVEPPAAVAEAVAGEGDLSALPQPELELETDFGAGRITHLNLNDGTVEGLSLDEIPAFSVQYHPEAGPGPHDSRYLFQEFVEAMSSARVDGAGRS